MSPSAIPPWKHDELRRVEENCVASHGRESARTTELKGDVKWIRDNYISRQEFEDYQELITTRYARVVKVVDGVVWCILIGIVGAIMTLLIPAMKH